MGADETNPLSLFKIYPSITGTVAVNNQSSQPKPLYVFSINIHLFQGFFFLAEDWVLKKITFCFC